MWEQHIGRDTYNAYEAIKNAISGHPDFLFE